VKRYVKRECDFYYYCCCRHRCCYDDAAADDDDDDDSDDISESFRKYLSSIPGKHKSKELLYAAVLGIAHLLQTVVF
jgi:hypothetical protein